MKHAARRPLAAGSLLFAALALGCERTAVLAPEPSLSHDPTPPPVSGTAQIPVPPTSTGGGGAVDWFPTGIQVPAGVWVRIRVDGTVEVSANPEYTDNYCSAPGCVPYAGESAPPTGIENRYLKVYLRVVTTAGQTIELTPEAVPDEAATSAQNFVYLAAPGEVHARRTFIPGGGSCLFSRPPGYTAPGPCYGGTDYHHAGAYALAGSQTVSVEAVPPVSVHADRTWFQPPGDTIAFTASARGPLVSLSWHFSPGDTLATPSGQMSAFRACPDLQLTCRYAPPVAGRMYIRAFVRGSTGTMVASSQVVRPGVPALRLEAEPERLDRPGEEVTFTASMEGGGDFLPDRWEWTPDGGNGRTAACSPGVNPCVTPVFEAGLMRVEGRAGSAELSAEARVEVSPQELEVVLTLGRVELHPRIRRLTVNGFLEPGRDPDVSEVEVRVTRGGAPVSGAGVEVRGELIPATGGHAHVASPVPLESSGTPGQGPVAAAPLLGYFREGGAIRPTLAGTSDDAGTYRAELVAGYVGGSLRIIATARSDGKEAGDTVQVVVRVPGLTDLRLQIADAYWIGGTPLHPQRLNWYVQPAVVQKLARIATTLSRTVDGAPAYLQMNDASLPLGGAFSETVGSGAVDNPYRSHQSHANGWDIDIAMCLVDATGEDGQAKRMRGTHCSRGGRDHPQFGLRLEDIRDAASREDGIAAVHSGNHYHIRFRR